MWPVVVRNGVANFSKGAVSRCIIGDQNFELAIRLSERR